jgi:hypothetical protein
LKAEINNIETSIDLIQEQGIKVPGIEHGRNSILGLTYK